jgi:pimeloyl-ACP methyl ester carboxylesterase
VKRQAADLAVMLNHGIAPTDALGYSQGGPVVQELALDYPAKACRLILSNTYAYNMATIKGEWKAISCLSSSVCSACSSSSSS